MSAATGRAMDFGVVLQNDPPAQRVVELARRAEAHGFSHAWTFDSHLLWQEPYVTYAAILAATHRITVGPMVTNPATRDPTVTASLFATLNETYGNRTVCGIGRGDSAVRVAGGRPTTLAALRECVHVVRELANGRSVTLPSGGGADGAATELRLPWVSSSQLEVWVAAYGPKALALTGEVADGFILQLADPAIAAWMIAAVREAAEAAGRDPASIAFCVAAPAYVGAGAGGGDGAALAHQREQCRWFGGMVGNHVADIVARYGADGAGGAVPRALTDYIAARQGYDYAQHGRAGNTHAAFVPDDVVDRFCVLGDVGDHVEKLLALADLGVTQFALYLQHDAKGSTLDAYGERVIPAVRAALAARAAASAGVPA